jgi:putative ABC transport system ATP-binding protein
MLSLQNITKAYRTSEVETFALNDVSLSIAASEFVAIMGPSGCGKSTLLNVLGLLDSPTRGEYWFLDEDVARCSEAKLTGLRRDHIGFVFQSFNLIDDLTVAENVEVALLYRGVSGAERSKRVKAALERVDMGHRARHRPAQLSGGQQQRVAVARALVSDPQLILADEPTGNLDTAHGEEVMKMLQALNAEGSTIVMVTHSPSHADYAGRVVNMLDGRILVEHRRAA